MADASQRGLWLEFFLSPTEKDHFADWKEVVHDRSVISPLFNPLFDYIAQFVPDEVAPNILTVAGVIASLQAWYFCSLYAETESRIVSAVSTFSIICFWCLGAIDGKHATRTWNDTSLGELFKYVCDLVSSVFLVIVVSELTLATNRDDQWYAVQTVGMILFLKHYSAFVREAGLRYFLIGPGELISWAVGFVAVSAVLGVGWIQVLWSYIWDVFSVFLAPTLGVSQDGYIANMTPPKVAYFITFIVALVRISTSKKLYERHQWTYWSLLSILGLRCASATLRRTILSTTLITEREVIFDGLFLGLVTSDLIVAKMAHREIHYTVVFMACSLVLPHLDFLIFCFIIFYYITVFGDLMNFMNLPLLQRCRNVYCDGIYDLCHVGHKNAFRRALGFGNRLFVGVVGDTDANAYKRPPIMTAAERGAEVRSCKCVTKVIQDAPCFGLTEEFIRKHRIHIVCFGQEYLERYPNPDDDPYYKVPRKMGIAKALPRTPGLSTSDLISRIQARGADEKKALPPSADERAAKKRRLEGEATDASDAR